VSLEPPLNTEHSKPTLLKVLLQAVLTKPDQKKKKKTGKKIKISKTKILNSCAHSPAQQMWRSLDQSLSLNPCVIC
jgi:hypothetical protein